jgi:hypothetical protein
MNARFVVPGRIYSFVMVVLATTTHEFACGSRVPPQLNSWVVGPSPTMTR